MLMFGRPLLLLVFFLAGLPLIAQVSQAQLDQANAAYRETLRDLRDSWTPGSETCIGPAETYWQNGAASLSRICDQLSITVSPYPNNSPFIPYRPKGLAYSVSVSNIGYGTIETDYTDWRLYAPTDSDQTANSPRQVPKDMRKDAYWNAFRRTTLGPLDHVFGDVYFPLLKGDTGTLLYRLPSGTEVEFRVLLK
jgi:hypothetical protein